MNQLVRMLALLLLASNTHTARGQDCYEPDVGKRLVARMQGTRRAITALAAHATKPLLVSASSDGKLMVWRQTTKNLWARVSTIASKHTGCCVSLMYNEALDRFVSWGIKDDRKVWRLEDESLVLDVMPHIHFVQPKKDVSLWGETLKKIPYFYTISNAVCNARGTVLIFGCPESELFIFKKGKGGAWEQDTQFTLWLSITALLYIDNPRKRNIACEHKGNEMLIVGLDQGHIMVWEIRPNYGEKFDGPPKAFMAWQLYG